MYYRLYFDGALYDSTKYENKEEAEAVAAACNNDRAFVSRFGAVYVADKWGQYVSAPVSF